MERPKSYNFTASYKKSGRWYLGWIEEIPGVNTQGKTLKEVKENLEDALYLVLETNRIVSQKESKKLGGKITRGLISSAAPSRN